MDIDTLNRSLHETSVRRSAKPKDASATPRVTAETVKVDVDADAASARLLRDAVREAGLFQRSVLGHLDHKEWRDRVRMDGQRLVDLLTEIGFRPSELATRKSA